MCKTFVPILTSEKYAGNASLDLRAGLQARGLSSILCEFEKTES